MAKKESGIDPILLEARKRFKRCEDWEAEARRRFKADIKFANADSDNGWQWEDDIRSSRNLDNRPCLTINKTRQHNLQVINDAKQNKPSVTIRPVGDGATYKAAQVFEGVVRHIEYISGGEVVYDTATTFQVQGGIGYWRVVTDYAEGDTLDQEIFLRRVKDPLTIYLDPDIRELDGSDARFGFVFDDIDKDDWHAQHPHFKDVGDLPTIGAGDDWLNQKKIRIAEYFRVVEKSDQLLSYVDDQGQRQTARASKLPPEVIVELLKDETTRTREVTDRKIEWYKIAGDKIVEKGTWLGKYIPIVRVIGEETVIDGRLDRKGHTRAMKDSQRQYNYWTSAAAEFVALQGKSPFVGSARAIEGLESYWETANTENYSMLPYNDIDEAGQPIARPERSAPPVMAPAYISGMQVARQELMEVSGQYQAEMGAPSNERSGKAIQERQRQGDNATYHFIDGLAIAIRFTGKILIDLIPKIYDTPRVVRILAEDGTAQVVQLDPSAKQSYQPTQQPGDPQDQKDQQDEMAAIQAIFNPNVGRYDVQADIGPDYGTQRQETFNAVSQILQADNGLMPVIGDIMFKAADFPMADEIAERMHRMVPAQALGGPNPEVVQLQQQLGQMQHALQGMTEALGDAKKDQEAKLSKADTDKYRAETDRLGLAVDVDPLALVPVIRATVMEALADMLKSNSIVPQMPEGTPVVGSQTRLPEPTQAEAA
jgi:hypothetical protein